MTGQYERLAWLRSAHRRFQRRCERSSSSTCHSSTSRTSRRPMASKRPCATASSPAASACGPSSHSPHCPLRRHRSPAGAAAGRCDRADSHVHADPRRPSCDGRRRPASRTPSNHRVFGEGIAILAGDALFAGAFRLVLYELQGPPDRILAACRVLASALATDGVAGGQYIDITGAANDPESIMHLHALKTGALLTASVASVLELARVAASTADALAIYARELGLLFQVVDDASSTSTGLRPPSERPPEATGATGGARSSAMATSSVRSGSPTRASHGQSRRCPRSRATPPSSPASRISRGTARHRSRLRVARDAGSRSLHDGGTLRDADISH